MSADGAPLDGEEVLLDGNELAGDGQFFALGAYSVSPDGRLLATPPTSPATSASRCGSRTWSPARPRPTRYPDTFYGAAWSLHGSALFYTTVDDAWRPYRVWRHMVGTAAADDVLVYEETDEKFRVGVGLTRSERFLVLSVASSVTSEAWLLDAARPDGEFTIVTPRRQGVEYHGRPPDRPRTGPDRLLILHNDHAENFELLVAPLSDPANLHAADPAPRRHAPARHGRFRRLPGGFVPPATGSPACGSSARTAPSTRSRSPSRSTPCPPAAIRSTRSSLLRLGYVSLVTPDSVYDCDMATGDLTLLKRQPVLPLPGGQEYRPGDYEQHREWATASDGTRIPISLVCRKGTPRDGSSPFLIYGYGSYEISVDPSFSISRLSLLDRGFGYAIAHIRGGGEMGRRWYEDGKLLHKKNTFTDFVACAEHLADQGWTAPSRLIARGGSAGGLLMGAVANIAPQDFGGIVAQVPFVDALTSILDPSLPLTVTEWEEWGDPLHDAAGLRVHEVLLALRERDRADLSADPRGDQPERHPRAVPRARQVDRAAAGGGQGRAVPAEDRDGGRARGPQRPVRQVARGGADPGLDRDHRRRGVRLTARALRPSPARDAGPARARRPGDATGWWVPRCLNSTSSYPTSALPSASVTKPACLAARLLFRARGRANRRRSAPVSQ